MTHNTKDIEEWEKAFDEKFGSIHPDRAMPSGIETANNIKSFIHQELQKALEIQAIEIREEEANEYNKIIEQELQKERERCITKAWSYIVDATHAESWSRDELRKAVQSELDQPDALTK